MRKSAWSLSSAALKRAYRAGLARSYYSRERPKGEHIDFQVLNFERWFAEEVQIVREEVFDAIRDVAGDAVARKVEARLDEDEDEVDL